MTEYRNDLVLRIIEEIAFLSARMTGLQAMGLTEEITQEVERLVQEAGELEDRDLARVREALDRLRNPG